MLYSSPWGTDRHLMSPLWPIGSLKLLPPGLSGSKTIWLVFECNRRMVHLITTKLSTKPPLSFFSLFFLWASSPAGHVNKFPQIEGKAPSGVWGQINTWRWWILGMTKSDGLVLNSLFYWSLEDTQWQKRDVMSKKEDVMQESNTIKRIKLNKQMYWGHIFFSFFWRLSVVMQLLPPPPSILFASLTAKSLHPSLSPCSFPCSSPSLLASFRLRPDGAQPWFWMMKSQPVTYITGYLWNSQNSDATGLCCSATWVARTLKLPIIRPAAALCGKTSFIYINSCRHPFCLFT